MKLETLTKWREVATILSLVAVPIAVAVTVALMQETSAREAVNQQYVSLAVGILQSSAPDAKGQTNEGLRSWAADIVDAKAPIPLPASVKDGLATGKFRLDGFGTIFEYPDRSNGSGSVWRQVPPTTQPHAVPIPNSP